MKKIVILIFFSLILSNKGFSQVVDCFGDGSNFQMSYVIQYPTCGGNTGNITVNVATTLPNCTNCLQVDLKNGSGVTVFTQIGNVTAGIGTVQFLNIGENNYVLIAQAAKVPVSDPPFYTCYTGITIDAVDTLSINGAITPDPCPIISPFQGAITISAAGGTPAYTYDWLDIPGTNNSQNRSGLAPGSYTVTVTDSKGCNKTRTFTIDEQKPTVNLTANPNPICQTGFPPNVVVTWTATPGAGWVPHPTEPYSWNNGLSFGLLSTQTQTVSAFGNYSRTVIFKDVNGCLSAPVTVTVPADSKPIGTVSPLIAQVCPGQTVNLVGSTTSCSSIGATPCQYSFDNGATYLIPGDNDSLFTVNAPQTVTVRIRNQTGCVSDPIVVQLDTLGKPKITYTVNPSPICPNNSANVTVNFICNPVNCTGYQYSFNGSPLVNVPNTATISFTSPIVSMTSSFPLQVVSTCTLDTSIVITVFPNNTRITAPDTIVCANNIGTFGPVTLTATGFSSITDWAPIPGIQTTTSVIVVPSVNTTYTVTGIDLNGCLRTASKDVISLAQPIVTTPTPVNRCEGTTSLLTASGALTYDWSSVAFAPLFTGNPFGVAPLVNTTYNVIGTDANGCKDTSQVDVVFRPRPTGSAIATPSTICAGNNSSIAITVDAPFVVDPTGGYSYTDGASYVLSTPSSEGPFAATTTINTRIKDQFGCISNAIPVTVTVLPFTAAVTGASALCSYSNNGVATLTVTGGTPTYEYSIDAVGGPFTAFSSAGSSTALSGISAGPHIVFVRDNGNSCNTTANFTIVTPSELILTTTSINDARCKGELGSIAVNITGGTATYDLYINTIGIPVAANVAAGAQTYTSLAGGVAGALTYDLIVEDNNGCLDTIVDVPVNEPALPLTPPTITPPSFCFGTSTGIFTMSPAATGGWGSYTYTFNGSGILLGGTRNGLAAGTFPLVVTDLNGCVANTTVTLTSSPELFSNVSIVASNCGANGSINYLVATGGTPGYTYSTDNVTFGALPASLNPVTVNTTSTLYVRDTQGCMDDTTVTVLNIPRGIPVISIVPPTCPGGNDATITVDSVHVKIPGGEPFTYTLFTDRAIPVSVGTGGPSNANVAVPFIGLSGGNHILQMSDQACANYPVDSFRVYTSPTAYTVVRTTAVFNPGYARIFVPQPAGFTTSSIALASDINQSTGSVIIYNLSGGTPLAGPLGKDVYQMSIDNPNAFVNKVLKDTLGNQTYVSYSNLSPGPHAVFIRDANGCLDTLLLEVPGKFFIPNLVSPNGDFKNDVFEVVSLPDNSEVRIFNRWGDRVFESKNYDNKYDFAGLSDGVYYYDLEFDTGTRFKGWVQVIR